MATERKYVETGEAAPRLVLTVYICHDNRRLMRRDIERNISAVRLVQAGASLSIGTRPHTRRRPLGGLPPKAAEQDCRAWEEDGQT